MWWLLALPAGAVALFGCGKVCANLFLEPAPRWNPTILTEERGGWQVAAIGKIEAVGTLEQVTFGSLSEEQARQIEEWPIAQKSQGKQPKQEVSQELARKIQGQGAEGQNRVEALGVLLLLLFQRALPAKPSELRVEPAELSYKAIGGLKGVSVINDTQERKFFKVKCSDNMLYRVNPVFGAVEPGKSARIDILRQNGGAKIDKIVLVTTKAQEGEIPCREVFNQGRSTEMMVLPLLVQE
ncbi:MSP domain protein [Ancylostoma caninum]|uniref:Major sperm protein n=1 Tax=Ancylostoma caninum TaxID=29170 RepID=A0A368G0A8_ANCCA|nr:MSP domain protein [Ancylostoma caninum]